MEQYRNKNILKWGDSIDCDDVNAKFVFKWGLTMEITNGRTCQLLTLEFCKKNFLFIKLCIGFYLYYILGILLILLYQYEFTGIKYITSVQDLILI